MTTMKVGEEELDLLMSDVPQFSQILFLTLRFTHLFSAKTLGNRARLARLPNAKNHRELPSITVNLTPDSLRDLRVLCGSFFSIVSMLAGEHS